MFSNHRFPLYLYDIFIRNYESKSWPHGLFHLLLINSIRSLCAGQNLSKTLETGPKVA